MASPTDSPAFFGRRKVARRLAMQALYQWQLSDCGVAELMEQFQDDDDFPKADADYLEALILNVIASVTDLDHHIAPHLKRNINLVDPVERAILRLATYELAMRPDVPYRVILDEAISLTKRFGATGAYKFVNGVLDKLIKELRANEQAAQR